MRLALGIFLQRPRRDLHRRHFLWPILRHFTRRGHRVFRTAAGGAPPQSLDAGLLHVDATQVPPEVLARIPAGLPVLNAAVLDISKRRISELLVEPHDGWRGPVIVKTNANMQGLPDARRTRRSRATWPPYTVFETKHAVPAEVWSDPEWVVERFLPEQDGDDYLLRKWVFLGNRSLFLIDRSADRIVKAGRGGQAVVAIPVPEALAARRRELGFDYGKFDYVHAGGRAVLLDANSTPGFSKPSARVNEYAALLADGLVEWISRRA